MESGSESARRGFLRFERLCIGAVAACGYGPRSRFAAENLPAYRGSALAHNARSEAEVDAVFACLKAAHDANILKPPHKTFWGGYSGYFCDPDGHVWEVAHNPFWTVRADGRISMKQE